VIKALLPEIIARRAGIVIHLAKAKLLGYKIFHKSSEPQKKILSAPLSSAGNFRKNPFLLELLHEFVTGVSLSQGKIFFPQTDRKGELLEKLP
jgi:hypothetical protein